MVGIEFQEQDGTPASMRVLAAVKRLVKLGYLVLPEGEQGEVLSLTPPLTMAKREIHRVIPFLEEAFR